ncbi:uncharacterized protein LOC143900854 [Temnothorax americanus]|uniref:uncharacterized protein LOC143900854 n=1 Tax=Temnothorax americanus TaxID=1964332 RepID=UPI004067A16D
MQRRATFWRLHYTDTHMFRVPNLIPNKNIIYYCEKGLKLKMNKYQSNNFLNIICGYCSDILVVATQEKMLCHNCFEHYDEKMHAVSIDEDFVVTIVQNSNQADTEDTSNEHQSSTDHRDEMLINVVQTKPALYNFHKFPPTERTKAKKKALWKEVENMLGGLMTADDAMKRWKYLRDCYVRYKRQVNEYVPSGSGAQPKKQKMFRFYEIMQFIDDPLENAPTVSNLSDCDKAAGSAQENDDCLLLSTSTTKSTCENKKIEKFFSVFENHFLHQIVVSPLCESFSIKNWSNPKSSNIASYLSFFLLFGSH